MNSLSLTGEQSILPEQVHLQDTHSALNILLGKVGRELVGSWQFFSIAVTAAFASEKKYMQYSSHGHSFIFSSFSSFMSTTI